MSRHNDFFELVSTVLPDLTDNESLFLRAVALHETSYSRGWKGPGKDSNNMGAITIKPVESDGDTLVCPPNGFPHKDSRRNLKTGLIEEYVTCFRIYPSKEDAIKHLATVLLKSNVRTALAANDLRGAAAAMRSNFYYLGTAKTLEEQINVYTGVLKRGIAEIVKDTHEIDKFTSSNSSSFWTPLKLTLAFASVMGVWSYAIRSNDKKIAIEKGKH